MSFEPVNAGRENQSAATKHLDVVNNTGATVNDGDVVLLDIAVDEGAANSIIAPSTAALIANRPKAVVRDPSGGGIVAGAKCRVCVHGYCNAKLGTNSLAAGDALALKTTAATGGSTLEAVTSTALGTVGAWITKTAAITISATATTGQPFTQKVLLVGTDCNGAFAKD